MGLQITAQWHKPLKLRLEDSARRSYVCDEIASVPREPGVYAFVRLHGQTNTVLYIGQSKNVRGRLKYHLRDSKDLMQAIRGSGHGKRVFVSCTVPRSKSKNKLRRVLKVVEYSLINYAMQSGQQLVNKQGTKRPSHTITFRRNHFAMRLVDRKLVMPVRMI